jgi:oligopeptide/dipeptide ABC transporter ATP-binding protein
MHAGQAVEAAPTRTLFAQARHPYTARLMSSTPGPETVLASLEPVPGNLPDLRRADLPACRFAERCERASARCRSERPPLLTDADGHATACWHPLGSVQLVEEAAHG